MGTEKEQLDGRELGSMQTPQLLIGTVYVAVCVLYVAVCVRGINAVILHHEMLDKTSRLVWDLTSSIFDLISHLKNVKNE